MQTVLKPCPPVDLQRGGQAERGLSMAFCCKAARSSRPSRRQAEPNAAVAREPSLEDGKLSWNPRQNADDVVDRHALLNPHRSQDSCGIGINFRITETGDLEIESLAPAGADASVPTPCDRAALSSPCSPNDIPIDLALTHRQNLNSDTIDHQSRLRYSAGTQCPGTLFLHANSTGSSRKKQKWKLGKWNKENSDRTQNSCKSRSGGGALVQAATLCT